MRTKIFCFLRSFENEEDEEAGAAADDRYGDGVAGGVGDEGGGGEQGGAGRHQLGVCEKVPERRRQEGDVRDHRQAPRAPRRARPRFPAPPAAALRRRQQPRRQCRPQGRRHGLRALRQTVRGAGARLQRTPTRTLLHHPATPEGCDRLNSQQTHPPMLNNMPKAKSPPLNANFVHY